MALHERSDAPQRPACMAKAMGAGPLAEEIEQLGALLEREFGATAQMPLGGEASLPVFIHDISPTTDGTRRCLQLACHLAEAPAGIQQGHSNATTNPPLKFDTFGSHVDLIGRPSLYL
jgi:hypothetical protein